MIRKGNYQTPTLSVQSFSENDMIRTSLELADGVAMKFDRSWVSGTEGGEE